MCDQYFDILNRLTWITSVTRQTDRHNGLRWTHAKILGEVSVSF